MAHTGMRLLPSTLSRQKTDRVSQDNQLSSKGKVRSSEWSTEFRTSRNKWKIVFVKLVISMSYGIFVYVYYCQRSGRLDILRIHLENFRVPSVILTLYTCLRIAKRAQLNRLFWKKSNFGEEKIRVLKRKNWNQLKIGERKIFLAHTILFVQFPKRAPS